MSKNWTNRVILITIISLSGMRCGTPAFKSSIIKDQSAGTADKPGSDAAQKPKASTETNSRTEEFGRNAADSRIFSHSTDTEITSNIRPAYTGAPKVLPNGPQFNLVLMGYQRGKTVQATADNQIFLPLPLNCPQIKLSTGDFKVIKAIGKEPGPGETKFDDTQMAEFSLPQVYASGQTDYAVYIRTKGKSSGKLEHCTVDPISKDEICPLGSYVSVGKTALWSTVAPELNYIGTKSEDRSTPKYRFIGEDAFKDLLWNLDGDGTKVFELTFIQMPEAK